MAQAIALNLVGLGSLGTALLWPAFIAGSLVVLVGQSLESLKN